MTGRIRVLGSWALVLGLCLTSGIAPAQPPRTERRPEVWAIGVGISDYANPAISGRTSLPDPQAILRRIGQAGWNRRHQLLLKDFGNADAGSPAAPAANILPTRQNLDWAFQRWVDQNAKAGDVVVFYFAGESRYVAKRRDTQIDVRYYLLPQDANPEDIERTGWSLENAIDSCVRNELRVVCWLATAPEELRDRSREAADTPGFGKGWSPGLDWLARLARWPGVTAWLASDRPWPREARSASTDPAVVFTQALLSAMGKPGTANSSGPRPNLAACLNALQHDPRLARQGFRSLGGVPPSMTLWADEIGPKPAEPRPELVIQSGHADRVTAMAFAADGRLIVTGAMDSTVRIWSAPDRCLLRVLPGPMVGVTAMALTRDDRWLVTGDGRGTVLVHDRDKDFRTVFPVRQPHDSRIHQIALLPDGQHFVSIDSDARCFLWDLGRLPLSPQAWPAGGRCRQVVCGGHGDRDTGVVVAMAEDGTVRTFDSSGRHPSVLHLDRPNPSTMAVSLDGRHLALGYDDGLVVIHNLGTRGQSEHQADVRSAVHRLVFSPSGVLAIAHKHGVRLIAPPPPDPSNAPRGRRNFDVKIQRPAEDLVFSPAGDHLAVCTQEIGAVQVWRLAENGAPVDVPELNDPSAKAFRVGFTGNSRGLVVADVSGGLAFRPLDHQGNKDAWSFPAHRGKIRQLSATPDRQRLLFLDEQRGVRVWDIRERTCRRLRGTYRAAAFLDNERLVLIPDSNAADHAGRLILADRSGQRVGADFFAVRSGPFAIPDVLPFERVVVSEDGQQIAAASDSSKDPLVGVWETRNGRLTHWITSEQLDDAVVALAFSRDGKYLLTGGDSPEAQLWDLSAVGGALAAPAVTFADRSVTASITCAAIRPEHPEQVVTGHSNGQVHVWKREGGQARLVVRGLISRDFTTEVKALCFTSDGGYLAASGDGKRIWLGAMDPRPHRVDALDGFRPHHNEQISALVAWSGRPILVSGSDDTTIRLWDIEKKALRGTFSAANRSAVSDKAVIQELDWVVYTPDGQFDASAKATRLVHYRRPGRTLPARGEQPEPFAVGLRRLDEAGQADQLAATHFLYGLGEELLDGVVSGLKEEPHKPAPISIRLPPRTDLTRSDIRLTINLGTDGFQQVRLYHNDVPIPSGWEAGAKPGRKASTTTLEVPVKLVSGENRFYVMASQKGAYDSCSGVVEVDCQARMERGRVHILALGVGDYQSRRLRYAVNDAVKLSDVLHARGLDASGKSGFRRWLSGKEVTRESVESALDEIARQVEERPQDTVVVFVAGHTGVFDPQQFCLLLPSYRFSGDQPTLVAARGGIPNIGGNEKVKDPRTVLPYSVIERSLSRLNALNRLVIVDACQAESILYDPKVREIHRWMNVESRRERTSYLMAARRGEVAIEAAPLAHGLFTYSLLRGMRAVSLADEPKEVKDLSLPTDADFNGDGIVSTDELDAYAKQVLPQLCRVFPHLVSAARAAAETPRARQEPPLDQNLRLQGSDVSFPLIPLKKP